MDNKNNIWHEGARFVHNISTPIATLQLNLGVLAEYLPLLVDHYRQSGGDATGPRRIPKETLAALQKLTDPMQQSVTTIQQRTQDFSYQLQLHHPGGMPALSASTASSASETHANDVHARRHIQKILIIEDEEVHQQVAVKQLGGLCQVDLASNGLEAIRKWQAQTYDLVLMDFLLPGMSGPKVLQAIAQAGGPLPMVIGFTNFPQIPDEYNSTAIPIAAYLSKPFKLASFEALLARLDLALGGEIQM